MNKKSIILLLAVFGVVSVLIVLFSGKNFPKLETAEETEKQQVMSIEDLEEDCYYVWHNPENGDIQEDLMNAKDMNVFTVCPRGVINWDKNNYVNHTVWFTSDNDNEIPTFFYGDELLYISSSTVPYEGIEWEHFGDYGYTIGVANLEGDNSGHYHITNSEGKGYDGYIFPDSDAGELNQYADISELFLDKITCSTAAAVEVRENQVSDGGTVIGLEKDKKYVAEWYTGTFYQDYEMQANAHTFCSLETFHTYDYEFLHSNCISIKIPEWFKTGYYYVGGAGLFRYVSQSDALRYNGEAYDPLVNWNDPIIIYDENGSVQYDPTSEYEGDQNIPATEENMINDDSDPGEDELEEDGKKKEQKRGTDDG